MIRKIVQGFAVASALLLAAPAFAATISSPLFSNGQTTITASGGSTVNGTFTLTVGPGEVVEWLRTQADTMPFTDTSVGGTLGYQEGVYTNVPFSAVVPPNTGTFNVNEQGAGIFGGIRSISGGDNVVTGPVNLGAVRVVANSGDITSGDTGSMPSWLSALIALLKPATPAPAPVPTTSAVCTAYAQAAAGSMVGVTNAANVRLQGFLLSQNMSIPALAAGASFGFDGPQTESARAQFKTANSCQ